MGQSSNSVRQPDWDINLREGAQAELWVKSVQDLFQKGNGQIEVKAPKPFLREQSFYVEYACRGRDGIWRKSGIATTKAKVFIFTFGSLLGGLVVETEWLKRAARLAYERGLKKECTRGSNPTKAVVVSLQELWETRAGEP